MDKKQRDIRFVLHAVVWSALIMAALHAVNFMFVPLDPVEAAIREQVRELKPIRASELRPLLKQPDKPTMLVIYASWCGICHQVMPQLSQLHGEGAFSGVDPVFLSIDRNFRDLGKYLVESGHTSMIASPYVFKYSSVNMLNQVLTPLGSSFRGHIPYIAFFDPSGKAVAEFSGMVNKEQLREVLAALNAK